MICRLEDKKEAYIHCTFQTVLACQSHHKSSDTVPRFSPVAKFVKFDSMFSYNSDLFWNHKW